MIRLIVVDQRPTQVSGVGGQAWPYEMSKVAALRQSPQGNQSHALYKPKVFEVRQAFHVWEVVKVDAQRQQQRDIWCDGCDRPVEN